MAELQKARMTEIQRTVQRTVATFAVAEGKMKPEGITENNNFGDFKKSRANPTKTSRKAEREIPVTDMGSSSSTTPMETISTDITPDTGDQ